jgi:acetyl-CoA carboxylase biotin carboxyl carrier protein
MVEHEPGEQQTGLLTARKLCHAFVGIEAPKEEAPKAEVKYIEVKSPMVGTFYRSSSPDKPVYVKVGDTINPESVVCLIEAMKLFNDVKAEVSGRIVKVMVEDASPVEYEQVLFLVEPL